MMHSRVPRVVTWVFARLVPSNQREPLIGDLAEEYVLRADAASSSAALRWYLRQIWLSTPPLVWARLRAAAWVGGVSVALLAYVTVGVVEFMVNRVISGPSVTYDPVALAIMFPTIVVIGYVAARLHRGAAVVLGAMMLLVVAAMTVLSTESPPLWYRIAYFFVGPAAAVIGGALHSVRWPYGARPPSGCR